jgi:predicted ATP-binding protein involved in virulence
MTISKKDGFSFTGSGDKQIPLENLSSGEQHELVLFYELLFKVDQNSLVLLDEPELSLHIVWQQQFLRDLEEITKLTGFDILMATHSPQIIYDRWDLTVELMGPKDAPISNRTYNSK